MTTTGGPERSLADPAPGNASASEPILDGDDIVVEPEPSGPQHPRRRTRELIVGVVVTVIAVAAIAVALATRHDANGNTKVTSTAPPATPAGADNAAIAAQTTVVKPAARTRNTTNEIVSSGTTTPVAVVHPTPPVTPNAGSSPGSVGSPSAPAPTTPNETLPPTSPPSALHWTAAPSTLSIKAGAHAFLTLTVANPTGGAVTLPHPLSCGPSLRPRNGSPINAMMCEDMVQIVQPHSQVVAHFTIYATDSGDGTGTPLAAGQYLANFEDLHDVQVTITG